jgi:FAD/FMN-containing dehydrogenase
VEPDERLTPSYRNAAHLTEEADMTDLRMSNWFGTISSHPAVVTRPRSAGELVTIMQDPERYPAPVRAVGSLHSTTACGMADGGTMVDMREMDRILEIGPDTVTTEGGALYIDVARELKRHGLQFYVNIELGNMTIGSAACGGTKDASMPGEFGQVCSYVTAVKLVIPSGDLVEITEDDPELMQAVRSSYGLFGIVYEVTFRVRPLRSMALYHKKFTLAEFERQLPALWTADEAMMLYIGPFLDAIVVEFRTYHGDAPPTSWTSWQWTLRNYVWKTVAPTFSWKVTRHVASRRLRNAVLNVFYRLTNRVLVVFVRGRNTIAPEQMIRYPAVSTNSRYTFSIWAFPEERYVPTLRAYFQFLRDYDRRHGYRPNMAHVGYRVWKDTNPLFSYSYDGTVMTIDPVSTGDSGWEEFLAAYNTFCSDHGGVPLFNQTYGLTRDQVERAFGDRLELFRSYRERFDPSDRLLNGYFAEVLA